MASIGNITFACDDPASLAEFWAAAVEYELQEAPPGLLEAIEAERGDPNVAAAAVDPEGKGPRLFFRKMPKSSPEHIPSTSTSTSTTARPRSIGCGSWVRRSSRRRPRRLAPTRRRGP